MWHGQVMGRRWVVAAFVQHLDVVQVVVGSSQLYPYLLTHLLTYSPGCGAGGGRQLAARSLLTYSLTYLLTWMWCRWWSAARSSIPTYLLTYLLTHLDVVQVVVGSSQLDP